MLKVDNLSQIAMPFSFLTNFLLKPVIWNQPNPFRIFLEKVMGLHRNAELPSYASLRNRFSYAATKNKIQSINKSAPAFNKNKKVVLFSTCLAEYNKPDIGHGKKIFTSWQF
jgi:hypothetical protein